MVCVDLAVNCESDFPVESFQLVSLYFQGLWERAVARAEGVVDFMFLKVLVRLSLRCGVGMLVSILITS